VRAEQAPGEPQDRTPIAGERSPAVQGLKIQLGGADVADCTSQVDLYHLLPGLAGLVLLRMAGMFRRPLAPLARSAQLQAGRPGPGGRGAAFRWEYAIPAHRPESHTGRQETPPTAPTFICGPAGAARSDGIRKHAEN